ncbi:dnaJ homolog subfamily C member 24-like [Octopus sinensis]|uniref:DnaJ homolog subfamily C member 24-like n=1 Tax=Octopus sinensis TaxID=2607531 RepID=A0A6P7TMR8_9MOLL|nr:dnaJ homolog subfamily C member 24-like [Octopus sinensis]
MENLYDILGCDPSASHERLKKAYQNLALKYHPDKNTISNTPENHEMFIKINQAWKILSDPTLRSHFDLRWRERSLTQDWPVQDDIDFAEFVPDSMEPEFFSYPCRCGGRYVLEPNDVTLHLDIVCCDTCSLCVTVNYSES